MSEKLLSVGLDVGTTSTQLIVSQLTAENRAGSFAVPQMEISERKILYESPVYFTPLLGETLVDGEKLREILLKEYEKAGISRDTPDTGAVIVTGETSRRENARTVLTALADFAGDFVVATAGPDLESVLAAKGAGADGLSEELGRPVLHMDIGGGTANLALLREGRVEETGCLNVGGRLIKFDEQHKITYLSPVLQEICTLKAGQTATRENLKPLADTLTQALEMAAGLRPETPLLAQMTTREAGALPRVPEGAVLSFSGGVADCVEQALPWDKYGDLGPILGQSIRESRLCRGRYALGRHTIRATVIGAGCHTAQLSGSTVFAQNVSLPMKNLPAVRVERPEDISRALTRQEGQAVIAMAGLCSPSYAQVTALAEKILAQTRPPLYLCLEQDMAKALGQALAARLPREAEILCLDRVGIREGSYLDVGSAVGGAYTLVVKTLVLGSERSKG